MVSLNSKTLQDLIEISPNKEKFVISLLEKFLSSTPEMINKMEIDYSNKNFNFVTRTAHYLKSSSGNVGAVRFFKICSVIQNMLIEDDSSGEMRMALDELKTEWMNLKKAIQLEILNLKSY